MMRHCNADDVVAAVFGHEPCGRSYDDLYRSTVCPHEQLAPKLDLPTTPEYPVLTIAELQDYPPELPIRPPSLPPLTSTLAGDGDDVELRAAMITPDGRYRYALARTWDQSRDALVFVMLNPSTADALVDDPTIRRCRGFAKREGAGGIIVLNLFGYRATDPRDLTRPNVEPVGPQNGQALTELLTILAHPGRPGRIVCGWGVPPNRDLAELTALRAEWLHRRATYLGVQLYALGVTRDGHPRHPLYLPGDAPLTPWTPPT